MDEQVGLRYQFFPDLVVPPPLPFKRLVKPGNDRIKTLLQEFSLFMVGRAGVAPFDCPGMQQLPQFLPVRVAPFDLFELLFQLRAELFAGLAALLALLFLPVEVGLAGRVRGGAFAVENRIEFFIRAFARVVPFLPFLPRPLDAPRDFLEGSRRSCEYP